MLRPSCHRSRCGVFAGNLAWRSALFWDRRAALCTAARARRGNGRPGDWRFYDAAPPCRRGSGCRCRHGRAQSAACAVCERSRSREPLSSLRPAFSRSACHRCVQLARAASDGEGAPGHRERRCRKPRVFRQSRLSIMPRWPRSKTRSSMRPMRRFAIFARNRPGDPLVEDFTAFVQPAARRCGVSRSSLRSRPASGLRAKISPSRSNRRWAPELRPSRRPMRTRFPAPCSCNGSRTGSLPPPPVSAG